MEKKDHELRQEAKGLLNRLKSIKFDADFVSAMCDRLPGLKPIPNERCGVWYINPLNKSHNHSVYFKSTDGHFGNWDFSVKRLNLHILSVIAEDGGCIFVDSTRSGKQFPDSLAKTIPIWCCVLNNAIARYRGVSSIPLATDRNNNQITIPVNENKTEERNLQAMNEIIWDIDFYSLSTIVSETERSQIELKIPAFTDKLLRHLPHPTLANLAAVLKKPLRPIWLSPSTNYFINLIEGEREDVWQRVMKAWRVDANTKKMPNDLFPDFYPVFLLSASETSHDGSVRRQGFYYVQGAADDHELWGMGLSSALFWDHERELLQEHNSNHDCIKIVERIVSSKLSESFASELNLTMDSDGLYHWIGDSGLAIGGRRSGKPPGCWNQFNAVINCGATEYPEMTLLTDASGIQDAKSLILPKSKRKYLYLPIPEGKKGQHALLECIPTAIRFAKTLNADSKILVHCAQGRDRSVAIALALFMSFFKHETGKLDFSNPNEKDQVTKKSIQDMLLHIQQFRHVALPSRAFMQRLNMYFCSEGRF